LFHSGGWWSYLKYDEEQDRPNVDVALLRRVWTYGRPYGRGLVVILATIVVISGLSVVPAMLIRVLLDEALPNEDVRQLTFLGVAMVLVPLVNAVVGIVQRWQSAKVGEGIIFDLRRELYAHLQRMSLRFFTATKTGELMNRLNSDVVGAQQAITGTFVTIVSNVVSVAVILVVMLQSSWLLTLIAVAALPLFVLPARRIAKVLRRITQQQMEHEARMSGILQESFNVSGAQLTRLFGRWEEERTRFSEAATNVRDYGIRRSMVGRGFFAALGLVSAVGTATVFWVGGFMEINGQITEGTVVMFSVLLAQLYGPLSAISNSRVEFATSLVSFERVFEVLDLEIDIPEPENPRALAGSGRVEFERVGFQYAGEGPEGLEAVQRFSWRSRSDDTDVAQRGSSREWALDDVSFVAEPGTLTALVGPSGAGTTTISYMVPRRCRCSRGGAERAL
jgi:ATP-binding cassette subfamily B protein